MLADWVVRAAMREGLPVQSTSIPGVAQRTGATTYYVEVFPVPERALDGAVPVLALYPSPGAVDVVVASELVEAGRALELGFVSPERTTLVASTHRVYAVAEKAHMGDGIFDGARIAAGAKELARRTVLHDFAGAARANKAPLNAVLLGVIARSHALPLPVGAFEAAVRDAGVAVEANLRGFRAGLEKLALDETGAQPGRGEGAAPRERVRTPLRKGGSAKPEAGEGARPEAGGEAALPSARLRERLDAHPPEVRAVLGRALARVLDHQDERYAHCLLDRLAPVLALDRGQGGAARGHALTRETARYLGLWMGYEDIARVAELKSRPARRRQVREAAGAAPHEPVRITEFLRPGVSEIASVLPGPLAGALRAAVRRRPGGPERQWSLRLRSDGVSGHLLLRAVAALGRWRRTSVRFAEEQRRIEEWLGTVRAAAALDYRLALEVVECANLNKGYGETFARGRGNYLRIMADVVVPALAGEGGGGAAARVRKAREAALADPEGRALAQVLVAPPVPPAARAGAGPT